MLQQSAKSAYTLTPKVQDQFGLSVLQFGFSSIRLQTHMHFANNYGIKITTGDGAGWRSVIHAANHSTG